MSAYYSFYPLPNQVLQHAAHVAVQRAVRRGTLKRRPCAVCGAAKVVGHHDDYRLPFKVRWLCRVHHNMWHAKHGAGLDGISIRRAKLLGLAK